MLGPWVRGFVVAAVGDGGTEFGVKVVPFGMEEEELAPVVTAVGSDSDLAQWMFSWLWGHVMETPDEAPRHQTVEHP